MNHAISTQQPPQSITALRAAVLLALTIVASSGRAQTTAPAAVPAPPAAPASAPTAAPTAAESQRAETTERITVTATRRREPAREVPMQVGVLDTEQLERSGAQSLVDYVRSEPGIELDSAGGPGFGTVSMRGVTTGGDQIPTVGAYVDEVQVGSSSAFARGAGLFLDMGLLDLNHIEILRGPQGTLYGASSMGGLIKFVTNVPDTHALSGKVSLGGSTTRNGRASSTVSGVVNVPLKTDVAGVRVSAYREAAGGWVDATGPAAASATNRGDSTGARVSLLLTPARKLTVRLTAMLQDVQRDGTDSVEYTPSTSKPVAGELSRNLFLADPYAVKSELYAADIEYDFGWARLNAVTSLQKGKHSQTVDATGVFGPLLGGGFSMIPVVTRADFKRTSQEFRLLSKPDSKLEWLAGLYFNRETATQDQLVNTTLTGGAAGPLLAHIDIPSEYKEMAAFGDLTWKFNRSLAVTGGIRIARNEQVFAQNSTGPLAGASATGQSAETTNTYLLTARYALDAASSVYARVATGYRPGGPNALIVDPNTGLPSAPPSFESDSLTSYELGYKGDFLNKALTLEGAIYSIDWKNLQQPVVVNGFAVVGNAGDATIRGAELAASYRPTAQWTLTAKAAFTNAKLTSDSDLAPAGTRLPNSPKFSASLQANHNFSLAGNPAYAGIGYRHVGARDAGFPGSGSVPSYKLPAYSLTDLQAGIDVNRFSIAFYVRNLFDKRAQLSAGTSFIPLGGNAQASVAQPRTFGLTVGASF